MMLASVVLPRPGGPAKSRWSAACDDERSAEHDPKMPFQLGLADELRQRLGPQPGFVEQQAGILG